MERCNKDLFVMFQFQLNLFLKSLLLSLLTVAGKTLWQRCEIVCEQWKINKFIRFITLLHRIGLSWMLTTAYTDQIMTRAARKSVSDRWYSDNRHNCASNVAYLKPLISTASAVFYASLLIARQPRGIRMSFFSVTAKLQIAVRLLPKSSCFDWTKIYVNWFV